MSASADPGTPGEPDEPAAPVVPLQQSDGKQWPLLVQLGLILAGVGLVFLVLFYVAGVLYTRYWWPLNDPGLLDVVDMAKAAATATALLGGAVAIGLGIRRQRSTEATVKETVRANVLNAHAQQVNADSYALDQRRADREDVSYLRDRFTTAAGQLGHDADPVRLAGVYAMAALADDWLRRDNQHEAQVCVDVLCGYVRTRRDYGDSEVKKQADTEIRQTIVRTITAHLQPDKRRGDLPSWSEMNLDFTGSRFEGTYSFRDAEFTGGEVSFFGAEFAGGKVFFNRFHFAAGHVTFNHAQFTGGQVFFLGAEFSAGQVTFNGAQFTGGTIIFSVDGLGTATISGGRDSVTAAKFAMQVPGPWKSDHPPVRWPRYYKEGQR